MSSTNAYGPLVRDWESLAGSCEANRDILPGIDTVRAPLVHVLTELTTLKSLQEELEGQRQRTTQRINELMEEGKESARRARGFVKARLGTRNERLSQFGIAPVRKRGRRKVKPAVEETVETQAPAEPAAG